MPHKSRKKPPKITIRLKDLEQHECLTQAAAIEDTSVNKFMIRKSVAAAKKVIAERNTETTGA